MPWARCYTLNIDDLAAATGRRFTLPRNVRPVSATSGAEEAGFALGPDVLEVIHLNGTIEDVPSDVTFSVSQYAERLARPDPFYLRLVGDLLSHPVVFVGTRLDETPLWQHLELRQPRGARALRELRPRSFLVTPVIDRARLSLLADFNVQWIPLTAEEFAHEFLEPLREVQQVGLEFLKAQMVTRQSDRATLPDVTELARAPLRTTEFLLG